MSTSPHVTFRQLNNTHMSVRPKCCNTVLCFMKYDSESHYLVSITLQVHFLSLVFDIRQAVVGQNTLECCPRVFLLRKQHSEEVPWSLDEDEAGVVRSICVSEVTIGSINI